jgi:hypothetical protein
MSAESQVDVEKFSPYKGAQYMVHLRMGILANDTHNYELFMGDKKMAYLCRCSIKTVQRTREQMIDDGLLEFLTPATGQSPARYRFIFHAEKVGGHLGQSRWTSEKSSPIYVKEDKVVSANGRPRGVKNNSYPDDFEAWWKTYPKPVAKKTTFGCWNATLRDREGTVESIMLATSIFAKQMIEEGRQKQHILNSDTFLGVNERWKDYLPESFSPDILEQAKAWAEYDSYIGQGWDTEEPSFPRPTDGNGNLLDGSGRAYYIDPMDFKRRYVDDE